MTPRHHLSRGWRRTLAGAVLALTTTAALAACSSGDSEGSDASSGDSDGAAREFSSQSGDAPAEDAVGASGGRGRAALLEEAERVVSTGTVSLVSDDVADTRFEVQRLADQYDGQVAESQTDTGKDGEVVRSRMVLRVPVADFDEAMDAIEQLADLRSSEQGSDIVTEKYVDLQARVRAQEASLERVELLFTRAQGIRDIMAIESQLTSRQADLDSLKGQLRALDDRTSMSTITVHLERASSSREREDEEGSGFLAGLAAGWDALSSTLVVAVTVIGAVLPFALAFAVVGLPLWLLVRSARRRRTTTRPAD